MAAKIVTVVGATGAQGKGVVAAFLNNPAYKVRAITRNTTSAAAKALAASGAEVVQADLESPASLQAAFAGSSIIFAVTNFFEPFAAHQSPTKGMEVEVQQGINLANAAAAVPTLEHYIWSTLPNGMAISNGKYLVPHFEGKNRIDAYIRSLPALLEKTTFLWITWYHVNYTFPMFTPYFIPTAGKHIQFANYSPETPINTIGNVSVNITPFVQAIVAQPEKTKNGAIVLGSSEENIPAGDMLQRWARVKGVQAQQVQVDSAAFYAIWPLWAEEMGVMMEFWDEFKEKSWTEAGKEVVTAKDLGIEGQFESLEEAYKTLEL